MLFQAIRRMPIITAIPISITIVLFVATLAKAVLPLLVVASQNHSKRKTREAVDFEEHVGKTWVDQLAHHVDNMLEELQVQAMPEHDEKEEKYEEAHKSGRSNAIQGLVELGSVLNKLLDGFVDIMPAVGGCVGSMIGCVVRLNFVGTACLPFAPLGSCAGLVGKTIKNVLGSLKDSKNGFT